MGKKDRDRDDDTARRPDAWEQFRVLIQSTDQGRRITELADHKARYALVLIGVVNAAVIYLATRSDFRAGATGWVLPLMGVLVVLYVGSTFCFLWYAIQALRPRRLGTEEGRHGGPAALSGVLFWEEIVRRDLSAYREVWSKVTMEQLNQELVVISHALSLVIQVKYRALDRMFVMLFLVLALATLVIGLDAWSGLL